MANWRRLRGAALGGFLMAGLVWVPALVQAQTEEPNTGALAAAPCRLNQGRPSLRCTPTPTPPPTLTATSTSTGTSTNSPMPTETSTLSPTLTLSLTPTPTLTPTPADTPTATSTSTDTPLPTSTSTVTSTATATPTPVGVTTVLTFSELPPQPVDGLTVDGVTFGFTLGGLPSADATYGAAGPGLGPGTLTYVQDPSLEGNSDGVLTLDFAPPVAVLTFGVARSSPEPLPDGVFVELFDARLVSLGVTVWPTAPLVTPTDTQLTYSEALVAVAGGPISRAVLTFGLNEATRFAIDTLTFGPG